MPRPSPAASSLRQGTLSFSSFKRTASNSSAAGKNSAHATPVVTPPVFLRGGKSTVETISSDDDSESDSDTESDADPTIFAKEERRSTVDPEPANETTFDDAGEPPEKRRRTARGTAAVKVLAAVRAKAKPTPAEVRSKEASANVSPVAVAEVPASLDAQDKAGKYKKHYTEVKKRMGPMVHGKGQSKVDQILRVFDFSYEYGPCIGVPRLQRWERAEAMGLNPPPEVRDILLTKKGREMDTLAQCVLYGEV